jgi:hypothetical protein
VKAKVLTDMLNIIGIKKSSHSDASSKAQLGVSVSKFALKKNLKSSYVASATDDSTNSNNPLQHMCYFTFHGDFNLRDVESSSATGDFKDLSFPLSTPCNNSTEEQSKYHEKIATLQFRDDFVASHDRKVVNEFLLEQLRAERSQNGFRLIYPAEAKYGLYHNFFSEARYYNELLGRLVFYVYSYKEVAGQSVAIMKHKKIGERRANTTMDQSRPLPNDDESQEIKFQSSIWNQIHNKWARALGRSTMNI